MCKLEYAECILESGEKSATERAEYPLSSRTKNLSFKASDFGWKINRQFKREKKERIETTVHILCVCVCMWV